MEDMTTTRTLVYSRGNRAPVEKSGQQRNAAEKCSSNELQYHTHWAVTTPHFDTYYASMSMSLVGVDFYICAFSSCSVSCGVEVTVARLLRVYPSRCCRISASYKIQALKPTFSLLLYILMSHSTTQSHLSATKRCLRCSWSCQTPLLQRSRRQTSWFAGQEEVKTRVALS